MTHFAVDTQPVRYKMDPETPLLGALHNVRSIVAITAEDISAAIVNQFGATNHTAWGPFNEAP